MSRLIVGLGNPGLQYAGTRHNAGFLLVDRLISQLGAKEVRSGRNFLLWQATHEETSIFLMKPLTYMNLSGEALVAFFESHPMPLEQVLVVYDDVAIPLGRIRVRPNGSAGGQKGIRHIMDTFQTSNVPRLRFGILGESRGQEPLPDYVLGDFDEGEVGILDQTLDLASNACLQWLDDDILDVMSRVNSKSAIKPDNVETNVSDLEE